MFSNHLPPIVFLYTLLFPINSSELVNKEKKEFCRTLECDETYDKRVCGLRIEDGQIRLRIFDNECVLLHYGCQVDEERAYGIINMEYCDKAAPEDFNAISSENLNRNYNCSFCLDDTEIVPVCGIREDGEGFRIRLFMNECKLLKYNCEKNLIFHVTDFYICNGMDVYNENAGEIANKRHNNDNGNANTYAANVELTDYDENLTRDEDLNKTAAETHTEIETVVKGNTVKANIKLKNVIVVDGSMIDKNNINDSIDNFFAATHMFDLPVREDLNETARRMLINIAGPLKVFRPNVIIPKNISEDYYHTPTLRSCYHKCPKSCPDTYSPVCGKPGNIAREPSLMFKNHCFMDVAQCKMFWEDKSETAESSAYVESAFLFCMGDEQSAVYKFLPLIRTLQRMGRLKKKGKFHYKFKNMRFLNNLLSKNYHIMG